MTKITTKQKKKLLNEFLRGKTEGFEEGLAFSIHALSDHIKTFKGLIK